MRSKKTALLLTFVLIMALLSSGCFPGDILSGAPIIESILNQIGRVGQEFTYQVIAYDPNNVELTYFLTEKPEGIQIGSAAGLITWTPGESQIGTFTIEVKVSNGDSFSLEQFEITIENIYLAFIEVTPVDINIYAGNSNTITSIIANYDNGDSADLVLTDCDYFSSNTNIATVNSRGVITGVSAGSAVVTVSYAEGGITKITTIDVTVLEITKVLTSITVLPSTMSIVVGNYKDITSITAHYDAGSSASILDSANHSSNNTGIASVSTTGRVTGVSVGSAIITVNYTEGGITRTDTVNVTVEDISLTSITVLPSTMSMFIGSTKSVTSIAAYYDDGSNMSIELSLADYQSGNTNATVNDNGLITGVSTGLVIITVSYTEDGITQTDTVSVTVISPGGGGCGG